MTFAKTANHFDRKESCIYCLIFIYVGLIQNHNIADQQLVDTEKKK